MKGNNTIYLSGSWDCPNCNQSNDFEGEIKEIIFYNKLSECSYCGCKVQLSGYIELYIDAERNE